MIPITVRHKYVRFTKTRMVCSLSGVARILSNDLADTMEIELCSAKRVRQKVVVSILIREVWQKMYVMGSPVTPMWEP